MTLALGYSKSTSMYKNDRHLTNKFGLLATRTFTIKSKDVIPGNQIDTGRRIFPTSSMRLYPSYQWGHLSGVHSNREDFVRFPCKLPRDHPFGYLFGKVIPETFYGHRSDLEFDEEKLLNVLGCKKTSNIWPSSFQIQKCFMKLCGSELDR